MYNVILDSLYIYPLKSAQGINIQEAVVLNTGFQYDRVLAVINNENKVLTARENPLLLQVKIEIKGAKLDFLIPKRSLITITNLNSLISKKATITLFKTDVNAQVIEHNINQYLSEFLEEEVKLILVDPDTLRLIKPKYNAQENDVINFSDVAPIHLINKGSLALINTKLKQSVSASQFRPNIIISNVSAFEEENWKSIKIGTCEFEVIIATERCSLININPVTAEKHPKQEPLRTLAGNKRSDKVNFGVYLVPRKLGVISTFDKIEVLNKK